MLMAIFRISRFLAESVETNYKSLTSEYPQGT